MGDNVLESQARNTKKRRSRRQAQLQQGELLQRGDHVIDVFTIDCSAGHGLKEGDVLHCYPGKADSPVDVIRENRQIGVVRGAGGIAIAEIAKQFGCCQVVAVSVCELTDTAKVQFKRE